jgi:hypothetical protein
MREALTALLALGLRAVLGKGTLRAIDPTQHRDSAGRDRGVLRPEPQAAVS